MSEAVYRIREKTIKDIADAIRAKSGKTGLISPLDMAEEILSLKAGDIDFTKQTATADNVAEGYTFYNKNGVLTTGTAKTVVGSNVIPINNVTVWQKCAGLSTSYTTVRQILANSTTLKALLQNSNARDYMIRSPEIMTAILANDSAIAILDSSMPYMNPDMSSNSLPYGEVTKSFSNSYNYYGIFNDGEITTSNSYYYTRGNGGYIQWKTTATRGVVPYKFTACDIYGQNVVAKYIGIDESGNTFDLTDTFSIPKNTTVTVKPKTFKKCIGIRFHIVTASNGANNWSQFCHCKMYAI